LRWRPFLLGPIFKAYGWNDSPFNIYAAKGRYMWRDLQRICDAEGLPLKLPPVLFPQNGLKAARLALVGEREGWIPAFSRACLSRIMPSRRTSATTGRFARFWPRLMSTRRRGACRSQCA
jgi:2-hydroxychromene-2-carboxylate isomerase